MKLEGKRIVLTGATSGIGYELVKALSKRNEIIVIGRTPLKLIALEKKFPTTTTKCCDLVNLKELEAVATEIIDDHESIDILINNAAVQHSPTFIDDVFDWKTIPTEITTNLTAPSCLSYWLMPALLASGSSRIVNINSGLALAPKKSSAIYCATKSALDGFTRSLRYQLEETNISVQQIFFELVDTPMTRGRGKNKLSPEKAAKEVMHAIETDALDYDVGKVKLLRLLLRLYPKFAYGLLKNS